MRRKFLALLLTMCMTFTAISVSAAETDAADADTPAQETETGAGDEAASEEDNASADAMLSAVSEDVQVLTSESEDDECEHSYEAVVTDSTCTEQGYTTYTCSICGYSYIDEYVDADGHDWEEDVTDPTCTEKGYTTYTCSTCGVSYVGDYVDAYGHDWDGNICSECDAVKSSTITSSAVELEYTSETYTGSALKPDVTVTINDTELEEDTDYTVKYSNNKDVGTATVTIEGTGDYNGKCSKSFTIKKASQSLKVKTTAKTVKYTKVKKTKQTVKAITKVSGAKGKVTYTKSSGGSNFKVNKSNGKITVKKGTKKGTYTIKIKIKSAATKNYKAVTKTVKVKITVK